MYYSFTTSRKNYFIRAYVFAFLSIIAEKYILIDTSAALIYLKIRNVCLAVIIPGSILIHS